MQVILEKYDDKILIEQAARTCYNSWDKYNPPESTGKLIKKCIKNKHFSVLEFASATFRLKEVSRVLTHQIVRHRIASYAQESQRYCVYSDKGKRKKTKDYAATMPLSITKSKSVLVPSLEKRYREMIQSMYDLYELMISEGIPVEDARYILPEATHTEIVVNMNLRAWREFLEKRLTKQAHWEIRTVAQAILKQLKEKFPNVFYDMEV